MARVFPVFGIVAASFSTPRGAPLPDFEVSSDASGALGYGAVFQGHWFSGAWLPTQVSQSIEYKAVYRHGSLPLGSPVGLQTGQLPIR